MLSRQAINVISWQSKLQDTVAKSSMESELISVSILSREVVWLRRLLCELGYKQSEPTLIFEDNSACIRASKNPEFHRRTKHIDIDHFMVRDFVQKGKVTLKYLPSESNLADLLTKALPNKRFNMLNDYLHGKTINWKQLEEQGNTWQKRWI